MRTNEGAFLSEGCPAAGTYTGPVHAEDFIVLTHEMRKGEYEFFAEFQDDGNTTYSDLGGQVSTQSRVAEQYREIERRYSAKELGQYFCDKVANCQGPEAIDGPPHCPAINNMQLRKLL